MMHLKSMTFALGVLFLVTSCTDGETDEIRNVTEITFNTRVSRATVTTTGSLKDFKVWADADNYSSMIIDGEVATKKEGQSYFSLDNPKIWPPEVHAIRFWAVSPSEISADIITTSQSIKDFAPDIDITKQIDLVTAYTRQERSSGTTSIPMKFKHALSQIIIRAKEAGGDNETKKILIKGAWIVNARSQGSLVCTDDSDNNYMSWNVPVSADKKVYGAEFDAAVELTHEFRSLLDYNKATGSGTNMMLVPQQLDTWNINDDVEKVSNSNKGAYILLLCRVEAVHNGGVHEGEQSGSVKPGTISHTHQMFPYTERFDESEYGFTCVPISSNWEAGKSYVYNLEFCGAYAGAGIYPPVGDLAGMPDGGGSYVKTLPADKSVGDPVLDSPIIFDVNVTPWDERPWTPGQSDADAEADTASDGI